MTVDRAGKDKVKSLEKALNLLILLSKSASAMSLDDLTHLAGIKKTSCFRLLQTMKRLNFVGQELDSKNYYVGNRNISIGAAALNGLNLRRTALPFMQRLQEETGETVNLSILEGTEIVFVERMESKHILSTRHKIGDRLPAHCTCMGKSILAFLPGPKADQILKQIQFIRKTPRTITSIEAFKRELEEVRSRGLALSIEELEQGLCAVAGPVRDHSGEAIGSINIAFPMIRYKPQEALRTFGPKIEHACLEISKSLGFYED
jgi:DNA-binding IclR family transcriptional regulator